MCILATESKLGHGSADSWTLFAFSWIKVCAYDLCIISVLCFPSVSRVAIVSKSFEGKTDRTEQWYGTQYKQEAIPEDVIQVGSSHL